MIGNKLTLLCFLLLALVACRAEKPSGKIELDFFRIYARHKYTKVATFKADEIRIIDWQKQQFELKNEQKIALIDSVYQYESAMNAYVNVRNDGKLLYQVSIVPLACASLYNHKLPYLLMHKNGRLFNDSNTVLIFVPHEAMDQAIRETITAYSSVISK